MQVAKVQFQAFLWFAGLIGAFGTIWGLIQSDFWEIFSTIGYIGMVAAMPLYFIYSATGDEWKRKYLIIGVIGSVAVGALLHLLFPFRDDENVGQFNLLALIGIATAVALFVLGVNLYRAYEAAGAKPTKTCPDCANDVLAAARKCQFCGYRFSSDEPARPDGATSD